MKKTLEDVASPKLNEAYQKVLYWYFSFPELEMGLNDLSAGLGIAKTTAKKTVGMLEKEGFLIRKVYGKTWRISCNQQHYYNQTTKVAFNLSMVFNAYMAGLREHILGLVGNASAVILFGSYRKGDDTEKSDIDIAAEVADNGAVRIAQIGTIQRFGNRKNVPVNLHIFCRNKVDINLFANIANGIVLEGFLEARP